MAVMVVQSHSEVMECNAPSEEEKLWRRTYYRTLPEKGPAQPQLIFHKDGSTTSVEPHMWGITIDQFRELMRKVRQDKTHLWDPHYSVAELVKYYVGPWTAGTGMGYALLVNCAAPKEVNVMVSHAWLENAEEFFASLERSVSETDVMYICCLANYQHNDGYGPTVAQQLGESAEESPFRKVLEHIALRGKSAGWRWAYMPFLRGLPMGFLTMAIAAIFPPLFFQHCIPTFDKRCIKLTSAYSFDYYIYVFPITEFGELWPPWRFCLPLCIAALLLVLLSFLVASLFKPFTGHMIAVPCRETDLYSRLWCVYEIFCSAEVLKVHIDLAANLFGAGGDEVSLRMDISDVGFLTKVWDDAGKRESFEAAVRRAVSAALEWRLPARTYQPFWGPVEAIPLGSGGVRVQVVMTPAGAYTGWEFRKKLMRARTTMAQMLSDELVEVGMYVCGIQAEVQKSVSPTQKAICGNPEDMRRIRGEIEQRALIAGRQAEDGYFSVDTAIAQTLSAHTVSMRYFFMRVFLIIISASLMRTSRWAAQGTRREFDMGLILALVMFCPVRIHLFFNMLFRRRGRITIRQLAIYAAKASMLLPCLLISRILVESNEPLIDAPPLVNLITGTCVGLGEFAGQTMMDPVVLLLVPLLNYAGRRWGERWRTQLVYYIFICIYLLLGVSLLFRPHEDRWPILVVYGVDFAFWICVAHLLAMLARWGVEWDLTPRRCRRRQTLEKSRPVGFCMKTLHGAQVYHFRVSDSVTLGFCIGAFCERFNIEEGTVHFMLATDAECILPEKTVAVAGIKDGDELVFQERYAPVDTWSSSLECIRML